MIKQAFFIAVLSWPLAAGAAPKAENFTMKVTSKKSYEDLKKVGELCGGALEVRNEDIVSGKDPDGVAAMISVIGKDKSGRPHAAIFILENSFADKSSQRKNTGFYYRALDGNMEKIRAVPVIHRMDMSRGKVKRWDTWVTPRDEKAFCKVMTAVLIDAFGAN